MYKEELATCIFKSRIRNPVYFIDQGMLMQVPKRSVPTRLSRALAEPKCTGRGAVQPTICVHRAATSCT